MLMGSMDSTLSGLRKLGGRLSLITHPHTNVPATPGIGKHDRQVRGGSKTNTSSKNKAVLSCLLVTVLRCVCCIVVSPAPYLPAQPGADGDGRLEAAGADGFRPIR